MSAALDRVARATHILRGAGIDATVSAAGPQDEIAAVHAAATKLGAVAEHAAAIRALGFRYVALDIGGESPDGTPV